MSDSILVLDDEPSYAEMLRDLLAEHGFAAEISTDPKEALERLHEQSYGLIVSDFKMPDVDGAQFLTEARRIIPQLPVIMVSGLMTTPDLLKVANIGVTLVLEKPFDVEVFLEHVKRFVKPDGTAEVVSDEGAEDAGEDGSAGEGNYPKSLKYLVDDSEVSRAFVRRLWTAFEKGHSHFLLQLPNGSEFSDVVKEIGAWRGSPGLASFHFSLLELGSPNVRQSILDLASVEFASPSVAVTLPDGARFDPAIFADFVRWTENEETVRGRFAFVYGVPLEVDAQAACAEPDLNRLVAEPIRMEPLHERLVDLAAFMSRFLASMPRKAHRSLHPEGATALLQYDWPGNHRELMSVLRRAFNMAPDDVVGREHVQAAIRSKHGELGSEGMQLNLESFLLVEQRRYLGKHVSSDADLKALSELAGVGIDRLSSGKRALDQPLLFPELLQEDDNGKTRGGAHEPGD